MILDDTHVAIRDAVRAFADELMRPNNALYDAAGGPGGPCGAAGEATAMAIELD